MIDVTIPIDLIWWANDIEIWTMWWVLLRNDNRAQRDCHIEIIWMIFMYHMNDTAVTAPHVIDIMLVTCYRLRIEMIIRFNHHITMVSRREIHERYIGVNRCTTWTTPYAKGCGLIMSVIHHINHHGVVNQSTSLDQTPHVLWVVGWFESLIHRSFFHDLLSISINRTCTCNCLFKLHLISTRDRMWLIDAFWHDRNSTTWRIDRTNGNMSWIGQSSICSSLKWMFGWSVWFNIANVCISSSINEAVSWSINQSSVDQSVNQPTNQPFAKLATEPVNQYSPCKQWSASVIRCWVSCLSRLDSEYGWRLLTLWSLDWLSSQSRHACMSHTLVPSVL